MYLYDCMCIYIYICITCIYLSLSLSGSGISSALEPGTQDNPLARREVASAGADPSTASRTFCLIVYIYIYIYMYIHIVHLFTVAVTMFNYALYLLCFPLV